MAFAGLMVGLALLADGATVCVWHLERAVGWQGLN